MCTGRLKEDGDDKTVVGVVVVVAVVAVVRPRGEVTETDDRGT